MDNEGKEEIVIVETNDGEEFEVPHGVFSQMKNADNFRNGSRAKLELSSTTFTRVLHFIDTYNGEETGVEYEYDTSKVEEFLHIAKTLNIPPMQSFFEREIIRFQNAKKREISWEEFCANQKRNSFWILVDGHIYDITKWIAYDEKLQEIPHPGGSTPLQAIKVDSSYFFEIYHATNECYTLMKNYYIGRLKDSDLAMVPPPKHSPSSDFLSHLRSFTRVWTD